MSRPYRQQDIAFFGATTASVSHELKNVVTIINETAGLLHDLTLGADRGRPLDTLRVRKIATDVSNHVARAVDILNRLNRFAHSTDEPLHSFELGRLLGDVVALAERPASVRGISLEARLPEGPIWAESDAFALHQLLTLAVRVGVLGHTSPTTLQVSLEGAAEAQRTAGAPSGPEAVAAIVRVAPLPREVGAAAAADWAELLRLGAELGVTVEITPVDDGAADLHIRVPEHPPGSLEGPRAVAGA